eukprot:scaffold87649_cov18-Tisochrysis_lutea.AAC.3
MRPHPHCCHSGPPPAYPQACTHTHPSAAPAAGQQQLGYGAAAAAPRCPSSWADPSHHAAPPAWNAPLPYPQHSHAVHAHAQPPTVEGQHAGQAAWQHPGAPPTQQQLGLSTAPQAAAAAAASRGGRQVGRCGRGDISTAFASSEKVACYVALNSGDLGPFHTEHPEFNEHAAACTACEPRSLFKIGTNDLTFS